MNFHQYFYQYLGVQHSLYQIRLKGKQDTPASTKIFGDLDYF